MYTPTPLDQRLLDGSNGGDPFERRFVQLIRANVPEYEELWGTLVWDITGRDISKDLQPRRACSEHLQIFAQAHYTFLGSYVFMRLTRSLLEIPPITPELEEYSHTYLKERVLNFYAHAGRCRDMVHLLVEEFGLEDGLASLRNSDGTLESPLVHQRLDSVVNTVCCQRFQSWSSEVSNYRNLLHQTASARIWQYRDGVLWRRLMIKHDLLDQYRKWTDVLSLASNPRPSDLIDEDVIMDRHLAQFNNWMPDIWRYFINRVRAWHADAAGYRTRLSLPPM